MLTDSAFGLVRILVVGTLAYVILIVILRVSGKRTLSKMNAFDFVVTVALGSTLATVLLSKDVPLTEGVLGFALLALLQFLIAWAAQRFELLENAVKASPTILLRDGVIDAEAMLAERVTRGDCRGRPKGRPRRFFGYRRSSAGDGWQFQRRNA